MKQQQVQTETMKFSTVKRLRIDAMPAQFAMWQKKKLSCRAYKLFNKSLPLNVTSCLFQLSTR